MIDTFSKVIFCVLQGWVKYRSDPSTSTVSPSSLRMINWLDCLSIGVNHLEVVKNLRLRLWKQDASATGMNKKFCGRTPDG